VSDYKKRFKRQKIKVDGEEVEVIILGTGARLPISADISKEMDSVASEMAYWGSVLSDAEGEQIMVDSWYRRFRAEATEAMLKKDPKMPEWKMKARIESSKGFIQHKKAISQAQKNVSLCSNMVKAFAVKANILPSKGAHMRSEVGAQGMKTPKETGWDLSGNGSDHDDDENYTDKKIARMEKINSERKKKKKAKEKK
jgi:hypothetical protein